MNIEDIKNHPVFMQKMAQVQKEAGIVSWAAGKGGQLLGGMGRAAKATAKVPGGMLDGIKRWGSNVASKARGGYWKGSGGTTALSLYKPPVKIPKITNTVAKAAPAVANTAKKWGTKDMALAGLGGMTAANMMSNRSRPRRPRPRATVW